MLNFVCLALLLFTWPLTAQTNDIFFARLYATNDLLTNATRRELFVNDCLRSFANFMRSGTGYNPKNGLTYDGRWTDFTTGRLLGPPRGWSAVSKESLHWAILALAIEGNARARLLISPDDPAAAPAIALAILRTKVKAIEQFNGSYPGFGGFLPWFVHQPDGSVIPASDWGDRTPGLDNGEFAFALVMAEGAVRSRGDGSLADRIGAQIRLMAANASRLVVEPGGRVRAVVRVADPKLPPDAPDQSYTRDGDGYLDDAYEGELLVLFITGFATNVSAPDLNSIWANKKRSSVIFHSPAGPLTCERGHWFSSHEQWGKLLFPYLEISRVWEVFQNGEKARTAYSATLGYPGLFASTHEPVTRNASPSYLSELGIQPLASQPVTRDDVLALYAPFTVLLANEPVGLVWMRNTMATPKAVTPYGPVDSISTDGSGIGSVVTWDGIATLGLGLCLAEEFQTRGCHPISKYLRNWGVYDRLTNTLSRHFDAKIPGSLLGANIAYFTPTACMPAILPDYATATNTAIEVLQGIGPQGGGQLLDRSSFDFDLNALSLPSGIVPGYVYFLLEPIQLETNRFLVFEVQTDGGAGLVEAKNTDDQSVTDTKVLVEFPPTEGTSKKFAADLRAVAHSENLTVAVFVLSDSSGEAMVFPSISIQPRVPPDATVLTWDGRRFSTEAVLPPTVVPFVDLQYAVNYTPGGGINYTYADRTLHLFGSGGWLWGYLPTWIDGITVNTDLNVNPFLTFLVATDGACAVALELKNAAEQHLVANGLIFGIPKLRLGFPDTQGLGRLLTLDLRPFMRTDAGITNWNARILAFSDPTGDLEIRGYGWSAQVPSLAPRLAITHLPSSKAQITWSPGTGFHLEQGATVQGPWIRVGSGTTGSFTSAAATSGFFRLATGP